MSSSIQPSSGSSDNYFQTIAVQNLAPKIQEMLGEEDCQGLVALLTIVKQRKIELRLGFALECALTDFAASKSDIRLIEAILSIDNKAFGKKLHDLFWSVKLTEKFTIFSPINSKEEFTLFIELIRLNESYGLEIDVQNASPIQSLIQKNDKFSLMAVVNEFKRIGIAPEHQIWIPIVNYTISSFDVYVLEALLKADFRIVGMDNLNNFFERIVKADPFTGIHKAYLSHFLHLASHYRVSLNNFKAMEGIILSKNNHQVIDGLQKYKSTVFSKEDAEV